MHAFCAIIIENAGVNGFPLPLPREGLSGKILRLEFD
jgi:hypothetical protein